MRALRIAGSVAALLFCAHASAQSPTMPTVDSAGVRAGDAAHPGRAVYDRACGACHNNPEATRAPALASLQAFSRASVEYAINIGYMKMQAKDLNPAERTQLLDWLVLGQETRGGAWSERTRCSGKGASIERSANAVAATFGLGARNLRRLTTEQTGLTTSDLARLELAWAVAFPQTPTMRSQPVVAGNTIFVAATDAGRLYALDTQSGCLKWQYESRVPLRSSLSYGAMGDGTPVIVAGDAVGAVIAVDARTGKQLWRSDLRLHESNRITGTPVIHKNRVYAPLSAVEINYTRLDTYECCKAQGAVIALDLATGKKLWTGRTMPEATKQKLNRAGAQLWGPSGAPIWTTPAIDEKRNVLYVGTGENNSLPVTETSDAIVAFDLDTGERKWVFQATKRDAWNYACRDGANCDFGDAAVVLDHDFGGSVMITTRKDGRDLLVVGQKSGTVWALDPDNAGALVWSRKISNGGANGGIHWGTATDGTRVFVPMNDRGRTVAGVPARRCGLACARPGERRSPLEPKGTGRLQRRPQTALQHLRYSTWLLAGAVGRGRRGRARLGRWDTARVRRGERCDVVELRHDAQFRYRQWHRREGWLDRRDTVRCCKRDVVRGLRLLALWRNAWQRSTCVQAEETLMRNPYSRLTSSYLLGRMCNSLRR